MTNIVLVHGAWADGSSWAKIIPQLVAKGYPTTAVQLPLSSLADDVATVQAAMALLEGPVLLVGHSYGGVVISEAGNDPKVNGLVYVAAFAPDAGQSTGDLSALVPPTPMATELRPQAGGFIALSRKGVLENFAQDLSDSEKEVAFVAQAPTSLKCLGSPVATPAWKTKKSWYVLATNDRTISPDLQELMSRKIDAEVVRVLSSHVPMLSQPAAVLDVVIRAATTVAKA